MDACVCPTTRLLGVTGHQGRARACQRGACLFGDNTRVHFRRARVSVSTRPAVFLGSARVAVPHGHSLVRVGGACVSALLPVTALCPGPLSVCAHYSTCAACSLRASHRGSPSASKLCPAGSQAQRPSVCLTVTSPRSSGLCAPHSASKPGVCQSPCPSEPCARVCESQPQSHAHTSPAATAAKPCALPRPDTPTARPHVPGRSACVGGRADGCGRQRRARARRRRLLRPCPPGLAGSGPARQRGGRRRRR